jgi:transcriptional regulator with XRE-family HTH domain
VAERIGELLRQARNRRSLTLAEISDATKIRVRYLRALETEDWDVMPAPAYARGFLRTYAAYLGLDADAIVEDYRRTVEPSAHEVRPAERPTPVTPLARGPALVGWRAVATLAVVAGVAIIFVLGLVGGGGGGGGNPQTRKHHHHRQHRHRPAHHAPAPVASPTQASLELTPTGTVWVCLVDSSGRPLINGETLTAGASRGPFKGSSFELNLGNGQIQLRADGRAVAVPNSPSPLGYRVSPQGVSPLATGSRPTCA